MSKAYSQDLRERVLVFLETNNNKKTASSLFKVSVASIYRWIRLKNTKGNLEPLKREYAYKKIDYDALKRHLELYPDHFLFEIAEKFSVTPQAIFYALKKLKITRKKRRLSTGKEMKVSEKTFSTS